LLTTLLAEITYPIIDPILVELGPVKVRWYGLTYVLAFGAAFLVLRMLARRGRWPVAPEKVGDVMFWGILGTFLGGRIGYMLFYAIPMGNFGWDKVYRVWEGGMSFHGGLLGVVLAYWIYAVKTQTPRGQLFDGLALATAPGIVFVRFANFINAELYGRVWDGPWAMRFPNYEASYNADRTARGPDFWEASGKPYLNDLRHPSQLYEALFEGLVLFAILYYLMLKRGWTNGKIAGMFLIGYGVMRFFIEFTREPDRDLGNMWLGTFTQGQMLCFVMIAIGSITLWRSKPPVVPVESAS
jgi:phosphatidylglycerol:prolipoprotein diacylglycerol transferase